MTQVRKKDRLIGSSNAWPTTTGITYRAFGKSIKDAIEDIWNKRRLAVEVTRRVPMLALYQEFQASVGKLSSLKLRIAGTDRLIDQMVYRPCGLTAVDIGVVEGA